MPIRNLSDLRQWAGAGWEDASDADLVSAYAKQANMPLVEVANAVGYGAGTGGVTAKRLTSSISNYAAGLQGVGEAVTGAMGLTGAEDYFAQKRRANEVQAEVASGRAQKMGAIESYKDVDTIGKGLNYAGGLAIGSLPYALEAMTGGLEARALMGGTRAALSEARTALQAAEAAKDVAAASQAKQAITQAERSLNTGSLLGGTAQSYPSSVGDILQNQREQTGGQTNLGAAALLGVPYSALNAIGPEAALAKGSLFRNTINMLDRPGGVTGALLRTGATAVGEGVKEGLSETGQEMLNQAGRMAVDDKAQFFDQDAVNRYKESFVGGAVLGGAMGGGLGGWRRSEGYQAGGDIQQAFTQPQTSGTPVTGQTPPAATVAPPMAPVAPAAGAVTPAAPPMAPVAPAAGAVTPAAPITPPVVSGGTSAIAQASEGQTQAGFAAQQQQAIQDKREKVIDQFGLRGEKDGSGQFFNRPIFGTNTINQVADALGPIASKLDQQEAAVMDAIVQADKLTGGKLVNFKFNGDKIAQSVQKGVESVLSVANKFQIGHVGSVEEAGQILNTLSQSAKGAELEQINAIHQVLTGKDTEGYIASQTAKTTKPKGKTDGQQRQQLPVQTTPGLGAVSEQGRAGQVDGGLTGLLQPGAVQPVGTGTVAGAAPDQQAGQPSGEGVRPSASVAADNGSAVLAPQVNLTARAPETNELLRQVFGGEPTSGELVTPTAIGSPVRAAQPQVTGVSNETGTTQGAVGGGQASSQSSQANQPGVDRQPVQDGGATGAIVGARQYDPKLQYYATDLSHISSPRRIEIIQQLLDAALTPKSLRDNTIPTETRGEIARLALVEQFSMKDIAEFTKLKLDAVSKQLQRMGVALKDGEFQVVRPAFAESLVAHAEAFRSAEFPDGVGINELKGLYSTRYEGQDQATGDLAEELQNGEQEGDRSKLLAEERFGGESGEGQSMGTISSAGGSQGAVESEESTALNKIEKLQKQLDEASATDTEGKANLAKQLAAAWGAYEKEQKTRAKTGETAVKYKEEKAAELGETEGEEDAVQVESADEGDVREPAGGGKEVGKANAEPKKPARARKAKADSTPVPEAKEEVKTPKEQWDALADKFPQMPPYEALSKDEKIRWDDVAERGVANLAAADKILSTVVVAEPTEKVEAKPAEAEQPKFGVARKVQNPYSAAELVADIKKFIRTDILGNKLIVVDSISDLIRHPDADARAVAKALGDKGAYGVAVNGKAFLIANRIEQGEGRAKFLHEVGAHLGLENLLPKAVYDKLTAQIDKWASSTSDSTESTLAKAAQARVEAANTPTEDRQAEMLAYFIEEAVQAGIDPTAAGKESAALTDWFRTLWAAFKTAIRRLGFKTEVFTAQDIVDMAFGAARLELTSAGRETAADKQRIKFGFAGEKGVRTRGMTDKQASNLTTAKIMDAQGELRSDIWYTTGWMRGVDEQWRTEFSDRDAKMTLDKVAPGGKVEMNKPYRLGDVLSHLPLYRMYPEFADYTVSFDPDLPPRFAAFDPANNAILMSGQQPDDVTTLLHEVQHAIQEVEGFGRGGSAEAMDVYNVNAAEKFYKLSTFRAQTDEQEVSVLQYYRAVKDLHTAPSDATKAKAEAAFNNMLGKLGVNEEQVKQEMYLLISGEVEARDVEARREYNNELRRQVVPGEGEGLPYDMQLVFDKNTGTYKSIGKTLDARAQERIEKLPPKWQPAARTVTTTLMHTLKKSALASMITEDVINAATKYMKSAQDYLKAQYARQATRLEHELKIDQILQQFDKLPENIKGTVNEYIHDSTLKGLWGYYPDARLVGTSMVRIDPEFKRRFEALPDAAQKLIKAVFEQGHDSLAAKQKAVADAIDREYADRLAMVQGDVELTAEIEKEKSLRLAREAKLLGLDSSKPYAYLGRYGDYVVVGKSAEYKHHEEQAKSGPVVKGEYVYGADSRKWLEDNRSNPAHYVVQFAETLGEADQIASQLNATGNYDIAESFEKEPYSTQGGELFTAVSRLRNLYDREAEGADPQAAAAIRNLLGDLYLHTVSEASARKSEFQRLNISGADKDMMRNLATRGRADAHFLAALKHNDSISDAISSMRKERDKNRREAGPYFNELLQRHANSMEYKTPGVLATALHRMSTVWYLSTSPSFYLQQILQTGALSLPYMAGRLGYFRSARAIKRAYGDMATLIKGVGLTDHVDFSQAPADVRDMLKTLVGMGKIDIGIDSDARARAGDTGVVASVMNKLQGVNNRIETINRATAAIAAYRGYLERYKNNDTAAATKYAADVVSNTHGSYDAFNTPRIMSGPAGKVLLQFKRFQIIQISMLAKLINTAFKGASAEEKTVARHSLAFIAGQMGVLGGMMAVPFAQKAASILSGLFGDPDEPDDWEYKLRRMVGDKAVSDLLVSGVPGALGIDVSGKIGLGNVTSILPFTDVDLTSRSGAEKVLVGLMGPTASLGVKFADALGLMAQGDYYKGLEQALPNGVANLMKGARFASEGITMRNGDVVLKPDEISMLDAAFQAVGLPTNTITDRQFTQKVVKEFDKYYTQRTTEIKGDYVQASRKGDSAAMADAINDWVKLQESRVANGYKRQPYSELYRAPMEALKRERNTAGGVEFGKSNRRLIESLSQ